MIKVNIKYNLLYVRARKGIYIIIFIQKVYIPTIILIIIIINLLYNLLYIYNKSVYR